MLTTIFLKSIQVASFLITKKTQGLYEACLRRVMDVCKAQTGRLPAPRLLVADYKLAILQATSSVFPTGRARGCYYHSGMVGKVQKQYFSNFKCSFCL